MKPHKLLFIIGALLLIGVFIALVILEGAP